MKVTEQEIRPEKVYNEYLELSRKDIETFFGDVERIEIDCPVCNTTGEEWKTKNGFSYKKCPTCLSIFVSPRPLREAFDAYYTNSESSKYWATTFYKVTESARREKLWKPKAQLIKERIEKVSGEQRIEYIVDIGGGYGVFDEEISTIMDVKPIVIEPSQHLAEICRSKGLAVITKFMEDIQPGDLPNGRKCFVSFELFEHLHDPEEFLKTVINNMLQNDIFIFTTLSGIGADIQVLGEHAKALSPPHHLNFMNPRSISTLLQKNGFEVIEAITPGKLDVDILKNNQQYINDDFWKTMLQYASDEELGSLQSFLVASGLSSHMMITARKP